VSKVRRHTNKEAANEAADLVRHMPGLYARTMPSASQRNTPVKNRKARIA
jgi:hypothetical protein